MDTYHIAQIGTRSHLDVFDNVAEGLAAFYDAVFEYEQIFFEQDYIGRFPCDIDGGSTEMPTSDALGRSVVNAVTEITDNMAVVMKGAYDALLLERSESCKDGCCSACPRVPCLSSVQCLAERTARVDLTSRQIFLLTSSLSPVSTLNYAELLNGFYRFFGAWLGRVEEGDIAEQREIALVGDGIGHLCVLSSSL